MVSSRINIDEPRYDQSTFIGRAKHFFITTNPLNLFTTPQQLEEAKNIVEKHRFVSDFLLTLPLLILMGLWWNIEWTDCRNNKTLIWQKV